MHRRSSLEVAVTRFSCGLTPSSPAPEPKAEGTNTGHENADGMASVGVRVQRTVRHSLVESPLVLLVICHANVFNYFFRKGFLFEMIRLANCEAMIKGYCLVNIEFAPDENVAQIKY